MKAITQARLNRSAVFVAFAMLVLAFMAFAVDRTRVSVQADSIPTAVVRTGDIPVDVHATSEIRAARAALLSAAGIPGTLQIVEMLPTGSHVRAGESVVRFDPAEQEYQLEQSRSELAQAEEELQKWSSEPERLASGEPLARGTATSCASF